MRDRVYNIFERYVSLKRRRREYDDAERYGGIELRLKFGLIQPSYFSRTHRLLAVLTKEKLSGHPVQFLLSIS